MGLAHESHGTLACPQKSPGCRELAVVKSSSVNRFVLEYSRNQGNPVYHRRRHVLKAIVDLCRVKRGWLARPYVVLTTDYRELPGRACKRAKIGAYGPVMWLRTRIVSHADQLKVLYCKPLSNTLLQRKTDFR